MLAMGTIIAIASIVPLYSALKQDQQRNLLFALKTRTLAVDESLARKQDIAMQIASRTAVRRRLEAYNQGNVTQQQLARFGRPILEDALNQSQEVAGITRLDRAGMLALQVGVPIPNEFWLLPPPGASEATIRPVPVRFGGNVYLVVAAPILTPQGRRVGTDIVLFRLTRLQQIVKDYTGLGGTGEAMLGTVRDRQAQLFFPLRASGNKDRQRPIAMSVADSAIGMAIAYAVRQETGILPETATRDRAAVVAYSPIANSPWGIAIRVHPDELYAPVNQQLALVGGTIFLLILVGTAGMVVVLRPLTGKLLLRNDELEQVIRMKTATLQRELAQRRRAEKALQSARSHLEKRVEARTNELLVTNEQLRKEIRDRTLVEAALRESEARYSSLTHDVLDNSAVGIFILDADMRVVWINHAMEQFFGLDRTAIIGQDKRQLIRDRIQGIFADPKAFVTSVLATYDNNTYIEKLECHVLPSEHRQERWLEHWSQPIRSGIYAGGRIEYYTDITQAKQAATALRFSEARLAGILDNAEEAVISINEHQRITLFNQGAEKIFGYTAQEILGYPLDALLPERFATAHMQHLRRFEQSDSPARRMGERGEVLGRRKNGTEFPAEASISQLNLAHQKVLTAILRDISDRKQAEAELANRAQALERSNRELEQFAHVVSHDLQQPLQSIVGFARILARAYPDLPPDKIHKYLNRIVDASLRMGQLIQDLLAYAQVGNRDRDREPIDCNHVLKHVLANLKAAIDDCNAEIAAAPLPMLMANETHMIQLFQNLISNALKYQQPGQTPQVNIAAEPQENNWVFSIHDNGIGIQPEHFERIFQIFQRLPTHQPYAGTGIGLATCKRIVERQGGRIWVESTPGQGTTVYFTHPASKA